MVHYLALFSATLGLASAAAIAASSSTVTQRTYNIADLPTLNTSAIASALIAQLPDPKAISSGGPSSDVSKPRKDFTIVESVCLDPKDRPILQDCRAVCNFIHNSQGPLLLKPFTYEVYEEGHCAFGIANLEACENLYIDPLRELDGLCESMLNQCAANGYDGFIRASGPSFAVAMSGSPAAPPYTKEPCT